MYIYHISIFTVLFSAKINIKRKPFIPKFGDKCIKINFDNQIAHPEWFSILYSLANFF